MHADYLNITCRQDDYDSVIGSLSLVISELGLVCLEEGLYGFSGQGGKLKIRQFAGIYNFSFSGQILSKCREFNLLGSLLSCFTDVPHRVTRLDIAHDIKQFTPHVIGRLYNSANRGEVSFSRKALDKKYIKRIISTSRYGGGADTGTLYIGSRKHDVSLMVYDKRQELLDNTGNDIGYNLTRYELRLSRKAGMSLRDVFTPDPLFWNHMGDVIGAPKNVSEWVSGSEGFVVADRVASLPAVLLKRRIESSAELKDLLRLADQVGPEGRAYALNLIARLSETIPTPSSPQRGDVVGDGHQVR